MEPKTLLEIINRIKDFIDDNDICEAKEYVESDIIQADGVLAGAVTFLYSHHNKDLVSKLLEVQHESHNLIISMQHIHLDHDTCLEILAIRGESKDVKSLYYKIKALKGVKLASISATAIS